jgi:inner membrane protein
LAVDLELELLGTERLGIVPLGGATQVALRSNWPHPSFNGQFLPSERTVTAEGFDAQWRISSLSSTAQRTVQQQRPLCDGSSMRESPHDTAVDAAADVAAAVVTIAEGPSGSGCTETLGVSFVDPSNTYALSHRATRYGLLFIALTFVAVGLFEFMRALKVHPVQYFLVGAAVSIFFLLLVSLSEHLAFSNAYALAATACVVLLTWYASHMLRSWRSGLPFGAGIATLYGLLYVLLRLEQTALLVGAVALFGVLALLMALTRKVNWYEKK